MNRNVSFTWHSEEQQSLLIEYLSSHLHWRSRRASPFISVYESWDSAVREGNRRLESGQSEVRIYQICVARSPRGSRNRIEYRRLLRLMEALGEDIPPQVGRNAEFEVLFLRKIPRNYVTLVPEHEWVES